MTEALPKKQLSLEMSSDISSPGHTARGLRLCPRLPALLSYNHPRRGFKVFGGWIWNKAAEHPHCLLGPCRQEVSGVAGRGWGQGLWGRVGEFGAVQGRRAQESCFKL